MKNQEPDVCLNQDMKHNLTITTGMKWHVRLWYVMTNPFYYVFTGKWRL